MGWNGMRWGGGEVNWVRDAQGGFLGNGLKEEEQKYKFTKKVKK